jgi:hypothetical protein
MVHLEAAGCLAELQQGLFLGKTKLDILEALVTKTYDG